MRASFVLTVGTVLMLSACAGSAGDTAQPSGSAPQSAAPTTAEPSKSPAESGDAQRVAWEGGPSYYKKFPAAAKRGWTEPTFFPIGVWFEKVQSQSDVQLDSEAGINTYIELTPDSDMSIVREAGMSAIPSRQIPGYGAETVGWLISDEPDMWAGPGDGKWSGNFQGEGTICQPEKPPCGFSVMKTLKGKLPKNDGRMLYANYGKGVMMWMGNKDAAKFVNEYTDTTSADLYWYTDGNLCGEGEHFMNLPRKECPLAANYGLTMDRMRTLDAMDGKRQPIYAFIELGQPGSVKSNMITPDQAAGAVMSSLIHEARGIIYFNHSFSGPCPTQHALREGCYRKMRERISEVNEHILQLAPALNTQSITHAFSPGLDTMMKKSDGVYYVFAMVERGGKMGKQTLTLPADVKGASHVEVMFEDRRIEINQNGQFQDSFPKETSYHIYKITP